MTWAVFVVGIVVGLGVAAVLHGLFDGSALQKTLNQVECNLRIYVSEVSAYSFTGNRDRR